MRRFKLWLIIIIPLLASCMKWHEGEEEIFDEAGRGLFILNEGNFQYGNASLSFYNPDEHTVSNEVFYRANGMKLGDVGQSLAMFGGRLWIVVNGSHVVFAVDPVTFKEIGRIENLTSPRYIEFLSETKAYVSQLWDNRIFVVDPSTYSVTGYITVPDMTMETGSTEQMVRYGEFVYCCCWSYQNRIIKIDTKTDQVVGSLTIGIQPNSLVLDCNGKLWALTGGGYEGSPYGYEAPALYKIDAETFAVERIFRFRLGQTPSEVTLNGRGDILYWINDGVWQMNVDATRVPVRPLIESIGTKYYGLTVDPVDGDIYVADAIDYQQQGIVYRYSGAGVLIDEFYAGITPGAFCWK